MQWLFFYCCCPWSTLLLLQIDPGPLSSVHLSVGNPLLSSLSLCNTLASTSIGSLPGLPQAQESTALSSRAANTALKDVSPCAFLRVQQEFTRLLTEHKKRLNDLIRSLPSHCRRTRLRLRIQTDSMRELHRWIYHHWTILYEIKMTAVRTVSPCSCLQTAMRFGLHPEHAYPYKLNYSCCNILNLKLIKDVQ